MTRRRFTTRIRRARNALAAERERTVAERDAFEAFERRISGLSPQHLDRDVLGGVRSLSEASSPASALDRVREAYRETVVALCHYDEEYGESVITNLGAEFGEEVGAAVAGSGVFTAELKAALCAGARDAASRRAAFLRVLDEERETLDDATRELRDVGNSAATLDLDSGSFVSLRDARADLCALCGRCEDLVTERQETLRAPRAGGRWRTDEDLSLNEYLYDALDVTYPILADASDAAATLREQRRRIERALTHTV